jgi:GNAT superfamily N-acetyltransferase
MLDRNLTLRLAGPADLAAVDVLLARSYPRLLAADYPPSVMVTAVPIIARARPGLLASGRYYVVEDDGGALLGAGGWSMEAPAPDGMTGQAGARVGHVRHFATDPDATRRGVAGAILARAMQAAQAEGVRQLDCLSTRTAVPFYAAQGFRIVGPVEITLAAGIVFPAVRMVRML